MLEHTSINLSKNNGDSPSHGNLMRFVLALIIVTMPLVLHFYRQPQEFLTRINQVGPIAGETDLIIQGIIGALGMLFISGEPYDRFNIPDKTLFDPITASLFLLGLSKHHLEAGNIWKKQEHKQSDKHSSYVVACRLAACFFCCQPP
ncbi:MAG: hypothetical protein CM1200mP6_04490 [Anaerolineaceae bacterium]|nr:MAG: hypothetical protein CM1200mP6_04490 [Anaerolineaceae bacterium]